ncbi:MAG: hypothetical protein ACUVRL_07815 [Candidatus Saccharicenans sp.]
MMKKSVSKNGSLPGGLGLAQLIEIEKGKFDYEYKAGPGSKKSS